MTELKVAACTARVGTGFSYGAIAQEDHASKAVRQAIQRMAPCTVGSVLLFLTSAYAYEPQKAIKQAAKAAGTPLVFGCCASSLLTEEEWLLDVEGAVAMVFPQDMSLQPLKILQQRGISPATVLTLTTPNAATIAVNSTDSEQIGAIVTDEYGHGPYSVWQSGQIVEQEFSQTAFPQSLTPTHIVSHGIKALSPIMQINRSSEHNVYEINLEPASENLLKTISEGESESLYGLLCAVSESNDIESIQQGHYKVRHVVSVDRENNMVRLSGPAKAGKYMFWATRDADAAHQEMKQKLEGVKRSLTRPPAFALMFPNIGRGAEFYNGEDKDLRVFREVFPGTPLLGFYGNGEIAPGYEVSGLIRHYTTVLALFA